MRPSSSASPCFPRSGLAHPGAEIEFGHAEKLVAGLFDPLLHPQPAERPALDLLLVEVIPGSRQTQRALIAGLRFFTCGRANLWFDHNILMDP